MTSLAQRLFRFGRESIMDGEAEALVFDEHAGRTSRPAADSSEKRLGQFRRPAAAVERAPGSNRISAPWTPLARNRNGANKRSSSATGRPLISASAPASLLSVLCRVATRPEASRRRSGRCRQIEDVPSTSRKRASGPFRERRQIIYGRIHKAGALNPSIKSPHASSSRDDQHIFWTSACSRITPPHHFRVRRHSAIMPGREPAKG